MGPRKGSGRNKRKPHRARILTHWGWSRVSGRARVILAGHPSCLHDRRTHACRHTCATLQTRVHNTDTLTHVCALRHTRPRDTHIYTQAQPSYMCTHHAPRTLRCTPSMHTHMHSHDAHRCISSHVCAWNTHRLPPLDPATGAPALGPALW